MKKMLGIALGLAMLAPLAFGQTNVLSQNAVGYVKVKVPGNGRLNLCRLDFLPLNPAVPNTIGNIVGDQLPAGSNAFIWDPTLNGGLGGYILQNKSARSGWPTAGAPEVETGDAFWLQTPAADATSYDVYLMGEVPGANNNSETKTIAGLAGFDAVGYPYPAAIAFSNTTLQTALPSGANVFFWQVDNNPQGYAFFNKSARSGWSSAALAFVIQPGTAFWVENPGAPINWTETKPYAWP